MKEKWKTIPGFEGLYEISNLGRIYSVPRTFVNKLGRISKTGGRIKKASVTHSNEALVILYKNHHRKNYFVSKLVAMTFIPNPKHYRHVQHLDNNGSNNKVNNLKWSKYNSSGYNRRGKHNGYTSSTQIVYKNKKYNFKSGLAAAKWIKQHKPSINQSLHSLDKDILVACYRAHKKNLNFSNTHGFPVRHVNHKKHIPLNLPNEKWKAIPFNRNYAVSNFGRVKSFQQKTPRIIRQASNAEGYKTVTLSKHRHSKGYRVNRLVASVFVPNPHHYSVVNHKDENTTNNHANNLEWCTISYNTNYKDAHHRDAIAHIRPIYLIKNRKVHRFPSVIKACLWLKHNTHINGSIATIRGHVNHCREPNNIEKHIAGYSVENG